MEISDYEAFDRALAAGEAVFDRETVQAYVAGLQRHPLYEEMARVKTISRATGSTTPSAMTYWGTGITASSSTARESPTAVQAQARPRLRWSSGSSAKFWSRSACRTWVWVPCSRWRREARLHRH